MTPTYEYPRPNNNGAKIGLIIGAGSILLIAVGLLVFFLRRRGQQQNAEAGMVAETHVEMEQFQANPAQAFPSYPMSLDQVPQDPLSTLTPIYVQSSVQQ